MPISNRLTTSCVPALPGNETGLTGTPGKWRLLVFVFAALMAAPVVSNAQYLETFSTPDKGYKVNCMEDFNAVNWSLTPWSVGGTCQPTDNRDASDYFNTTAAGALESSDLDQEVCWESPLINTTAAPTVSVKMNLTWVSFDSDVTTNSCGTDYIRVFYSVNGGTYTMIPNVTGGISTCATVSYPFEMPGTTENGGSFSINQGGIAGGSTLKIKVCVKTASTAEIVTIDNVSVPEAGVTVGCAAPVLTTVVTPVGCSNPNSGAINLSVSAGTPGYTYDWSNNGPNMPDIDPQDLNGLPVGTYIVTVTDAASCSATTSVTIGNAPALSLSTQILGATCAGAADGEVGLTVSGGVPGYTYDWSNNGSNMPDIDPEDLIGVAAGTYTVTVTDASGCAANTSAVVGTLPAGAYLEQFNVPNKGYLANYVNDFSAVNWSMSSWSPAPPAAFGRETGDFFSTSGGILTAIDLDQEVCWTSPQISRTGATQFSVDLAWTTFDEEDYINVNYSIDGGAFVQVPNSAGAGGGTGTIDYPSLALDISGSKTVTQTGLSGSTLQIQVCGNFNSESMTVDNVSVPLSAGVNCPVPTISLVPTNVTCTGGDDGSIAVTASAGTPGYQVSWSGPSSGNPAGTEIAASGGTYNITTLTTGTYMVTVTGANGFFATASTTLAATNPTQSPAFAYAKSAFCQSGTDPSPSIFGVPGGMFSAPGTVSVNASSGLIDVSASTAGGPYNITYTTPGPCAGSTTFAVSIVNCAPGATLTDAITTDNGAVGKADPGDRIQLTAKITNAQAADYENVQLVLNNDSRVTFVPASFKSTPVAVDDTYTATLNTLLTVVVGSGVITNDFDDNLPGLIVTAFSAASAQGGTVSVNANGSFTYNPPASFTGNDTFTYTITDSDLQTNTGTVRVRVQ
ncbi:MAG: cadherin-like domain-containing protein [Saprospiraceae bacterium]|nr:cadherin-like domain-containing protein [Saprospiraceae bacterium]